MSSNSLEKFLTDKNLSLQDGFLEIGKIFEDKESHILKLYNILPSEIQNAKVFFDKLRKELVYDYGELFEINGVPITGANKFLPIRNLYSAIRVASQYLNSQQLQNYISQLTNKSKHEDFLLEMRPLMNLKEGYSVEFENKSYALNDTNIDWLVDDGDKKVLFEVKNRLASFFEVMKQQLPDFSVKPNAPTPEKLFRSIETKFKENHDNNVLQGAWINTIVKEDERKLKNAFNNLDSDKVQFIILGGWGDSPYFLVREDSQKSVLKECFNVKEDTGGGMVDSGYADS